MIPVAVLSLLSIISCALAGLPSDAYATPKKGKGASVKEVKTMSEKEQMALALRAAPPHIAKEAGVLVFGKDGILTEVKKSENGFSCIPTVMNLPVPDPICMDGAAHQWMMDLMNNAPKPSNTIPGIAYMAHGGSHFEKNHKVVMQKEEGAKVVKEPAHWMVMWPFDPGVTKLPTAPNPSGSYIMFDGSPYAHLMVYQDPNKMH
jgi:hypothetical protein